MVILKIEYRLRRRWRWEVEWGLAGGGGGVERGVGAGEAYVASQTTMLHM